MSGEAPQHTYTPADFANHLGQQRAASEAAHGVDPSQQGPEQQSAPAQGPPPAGFQPSSGGWAPIPIAESSQGEADLQAADAQTGDAGMGDALNEFDSAQSQSPEERLHRAVSSALVDAIPNDVDTAERERLGENAERAANLAVQVLEVQNRLRAQFPNLPYTRLRNTALMRVRAQNHITLLHAGLSPDEIYDSLETQLDKLDNLASTTPEPQAATDPDSVPPIIAPNSASVAPPRAASQNSIPRPASTASTNSTGGNGAAPATPPDPLLTASNSPVTNNNGSSGAAPASSGLWPMPPTPSGGNSANTSGNTLQSPESTETYEDQLAKVLLGIALAQSAAYTGVGTRGQAAAEKRLDEAMAALDALVEIAIPDPDNEAGRSRLKLDALNALDRYQLDTSKRPRAYHQVLGTIATSRVMQAFQRHKGKVYAVAGVAAAGLLTGAVVAGAGLPAVVAVGVAAAKSAGTGAVVATYFSTVAARIGRAMGNTREAVQGRVDAQWAELAQLVQGATESDAEFATRIDGFMQNLKADALAARQANTDTRRSMAKRAAAQGAIGGLVMGAAVASIGNVISGIDQVSAVEAPHVEAPHADAPTSGLGSAHAPVTPEQVDFQSLDLAHKGDLMNNAAQEFSGRTAWQAMHNHVGVDGHHLTAAEIETQYTDALTKLHDAGWQVETHGLKLDANGHFQPISDTATYYAKVTAPPDGGTIFDAPGHISQIDGTLSSNQLAAVADKLAHGGHVGVNPDGSSASVGDVLNQHYNAYSAADEAAKAAADAGKQAGEVAGHVPAPVVPHADVPVPVTNISNVLENSATRVDDLITGAVTGALTDARRPSSARFARRDRSTGPASGNRSRRRRNRIRSTVSPSSLVPGFLRRRQRIPNPLSPTFSEQDFNDWIADLDRAASASSSPLHPVSSPPSYAGAGLPPRPDPLAATPSGTQTPRPNQDSNAAGLTPSQRAEVDEILDVYTYELQSALSPRSGSTVSADPDTVAKAQLASIKDRVQAIRANPAMVNDLIGLLQVWNHLPEDEIRAALDL